MTQALFEANRLKHIVSTRRSNRAYTSEPVTAAAMEAIESALGSESNPFDRAGRYAVYSSAAQTGEPIKLGTYGTIKNGSHYMLSAIQDGPGKMESLGYQMELAILTATDLGLGTCWLGGTFNRSQFSAVIELKAGEILPIIVPFGHPAGKEGLIGKMIRGMAGSDQRRPFESLFFEGAVEGPGLALEKLKPLSASAAGAYQEALEMVRQGPSASNKQPWRVVKDGDDWHFILAHAKGYSDSLSYDIQRVDMGIAVCHFDLAVRAFGLQGRWVNLALPLDKVRDGYSYTLTWRAEK